MVLSPGETAFRREGAKATPKKSRRTNHEKDVYKRQAQNSLYVILISQITSLAATLVTGSVPPFGWLSLVLMVAGGIGGGMLGRIANKRMDNKAVEKLFIGLMGVIMAISLYNVWQYTFAV